MCKNNRTKICISYWPCELIGNYAWWRFKVFVSWAYTDTIFEGVQYLVDRPSPNLRMEGGMPLRLCTHVKLMRSAVRPIYTTKFFQQNLLQQWSSSSICICIWTILLSFVMAYFNKHINLHLLQRHRKSRIPRNYILGKQQLQNLVTMLALA